MKFIVGIGNPGDKYDGTRHNIGFVVSEAVKTELPGAGKWDYRKDLNAVVSEALGAWVVKPQTFVNDTGGTIQALKRKFAELKPEDLLFVSDDVNLDFGKLRLRSSGSAGGHHGLESAIEALGGGEFPRLRFGVRQPGMPNDLPEYVLGRFSSEEEKRLPALVERAAEVCGTWARLGFEAAMNRLSQLQSLP